MRIPFVRPLRRASWCPTGWASPIEGYTLRECHVAFLLCTLPAGVRQALLDWLIASTDLRRWPPPASFSSRRLPFAESDLLNKSLSDYVKLLRDELSAIRQTLDFPPQALSGLTRYGLLVAHSIRLRQIIGALRPSIAEQEIKQMVA